MEGEQCYRGSAWMYGPVSRENELEIDLESGGTTSEEEKTYDVGLGTKQTNRCSDWSGDGPLASDGLLKSSKNGDLASENVELLIAKNEEGEKGQRQMASAESRPMEEKHKKEKSRKPPKPPRPPKGPPLDAADHKLMKEIADLAMRKRARIERIKELKKTRAAKPSSWNSSVAAMVITILFLLVIVFQGMCSRNSGSISLQGAPEPALTAGEDLISVQFYKNLTTYENNEPDSSSPNFAQGHHVSNSGFN